MVSASSGVPLLGGRWRGKKSRDLEEGASPFASSFSQEDASPLSKVNALEHRNNDQRQQESCLAPSGVTFRPLAPASFLASRSQHHALKRFQSLPVSLLHLSATHLGCIRHLFKLYLFVEQIRRHCLAPRSLLARANLHCMATSTFSK